MTDTIAADVAVVGAGPAGSVAAIELGQRGISTVIIEKDQFPRFHIGESLTGESGRVIRELGLEQAMRENAHAVKRGVTVYGPNGKNTFWVPVVSIGDDGERRQSTTWQVRRSDFDHLLLSRAEELGVRRLSAEATGAAISDDGQVTGVTVRTAGGESLSIDAEVVVDASGAKCFLHRAGVTGAKTRGLYDKQIAIFTHVAGARRDPGNAGGNTLIFYQKANHWAWFIPIDEETVSVGVVTPTSYFREKGEPKREFLLREFAELNSELSKRMTDAAIVLEPMATSNYSYQISDFTGPGFVCIGDAHRFIDPVFSFGVHFGMHEGRKIAPIIEAHLGAGAPAGVNPFEDFERHAESGQDVIQDMLDAFWLEPFGFAYSVHQVHRDEIIDFFAGRVYDVPDDRPGLKAIRKLAASGRSRVEREALVGT